MWCPHSGSSEVDFLLNHKVISYKLIYEWGEKSMIIKGFKFGMILQIAIGPICLFIFQSSCKNGFLVGEIGVLAAALADTIYILAAIYGIGTFIEKNKNAKKYLKIFGIIVLIIFGISTILGVFNISFIPSFNVSSTISSNEVFLTTLVLTLSSPLTIVFWAGVFSSKIIEEDMKKREMILFGCGAVISTILFLSIISILGSVTSNFLDEKYIKALNLLVGLILIYFAIKLVIKKDAKKEEIDL